MKAILEFDLTSERQEHEAAVHGMEWSLSLWDIDQEIRKWMKYGNDFKTVDEALDNVRKLIAETLDEKGLTFYD